LVSLFAETFEFLEARRDPDVFSIPL